MKMPIYFLDSCTSQPFKGNPTPVCILSNDYPKKVLQSIATEMNQPVTVFILKETEEYYKIRYFTSTTEIPACGHGTLAAAKLLNVIDGTEKIEFITAEGLRIPVKIESGLVCIEYPVFNLHETRVDRKILSAIGIEKYVYAGATTELQMLMIELDDPSLLRQVKPDFIKLVNSDSELTEVVITSIADRPEYDFLLRSFCPWIGIDEDPVTGSVHSSLAPFWKNKLKKDPLRAYQASSRGGEIQVSVTNDKSVSLKADAIVIFRGEIELYL